SVHLSNDRPPNGSTDRFGRRRLQTPLTKRRLFFPSFKFLPQPCVFSSIRLEHLRYPHCVFARIVHTAPNSRRHSGQQRRAESRPFVHAHPLRGHAKQVGKGLHPKVTSAAASVYANRTARCGAKRHQRVITFQQTE